MPTPTVTVIVPTRNRPELLRRALASVAAQTLQSIEAVIVDDGSDAERADANRSVVHAFGSRFTLLQPLAPGEAGRGPAASRNRGLDEAGGTYVAFLDDDDVWTWDQHLECGAAMLGETDLDAYVADIHSYRGDRLVMTTWMQDAPTRAGVLAEPIHRDAPRVHRVSRRRFVAAATKNAPHLNGTMLARRRLEPPMRFRKTLHFAEDHEFILRFADRIDHVLVSPQPVARYRLPEGDSVSLSVGIMDRHLQLLAAAQGLRVAATSPEVRTAARQIEAWAWRLLADGHSAAGERGAAVRAGMQALVVYPSLGAAAAIVRRAISRAA